MAELYFERYMDLAARAGDDYSRGITPGDLIGGIEDIGGRETALISKAVPVEAALISRALQAADVSWNTMVEFSDDIPMRRDGGYHAKGWLLGSLDPVPYATADGTVHKAERPSAIVAEDGNVYPYWRQPIDERETTFIEGPILNRYAPACSTSMNNRRVLYGLASLAHRNKLEIPN